MSASAPLAVFLVEEISFIIALAISSVAFDQASTTLLYFSPCDQTVVVLLLEILRQRTGGVDDLPLGVRHDHVVLAERNAGLERVVEAERHDAVAEDHRLLLAAVTIDLVDHAGDLALGHQLVDDLVRDARVLRQQIAEHDAARGGLDPAR